MPDPKPIHRSAELRAALIAIIHKCGPVEVTNEEMGEALIAETSGGRELAVELTEGGAVFMLIDRERDR